MGLGGFIRGVFFLLGLVLTGMAFFTGYAGDFQLYAMIGGPVLLVLSLLWWWKAKKKKSRMEPAQTGLPPGAVASRKEALRHTIPRPAMTDREIGRAGRKLQEKRLRKKRVFKEGGAGQWTIPPGMRKRKVS
jgi:hypothetical protein